MQIRFDVRGSLLSRWFAPVSGLLVLAGMSAFVLPGQEARDAKRAGVFAYLTVRDATPEAGAVAVIDTTTNRVVATAPVGPGPNGMVVTSNGKRAYVTNYGSFGGPFAQASKLANTISVLDLIPEQGRKKDDPQPRTVATITVGEGPLGIAITPDNKEVYVSNFGQDSTLVPGAVEGNTVSVIKTGKNRVVATIPVGNLPAGVAVRPDGKRVYVTSRRGNQIWVISTATYAVLDVIPVQNEPANVAFSPDGKRAYVTNFGSNSVSVIDTEKETVIPVPDGVAVRVGMVPVGITVSPDGRRVYVVNVFSNNISVIDTATNTVVATIPAAAQSGPRAVATTPDGTRAYVTSFLDNTVLEINTSTNTVTGTIPVSGGPNWVTIPR